MTWPKKSMLYLGTKNKAVCLGTCMGMEPLRSSAPIPLACLNYSLIFFLTWSKGDYDAQYTTRHSPAAQDFNAYWIHCNFWNALKNFLILSSFTTSFWGILPRFVCTWVEQVIFQEVLDGKFWGLIQEPLELNAMRVECMVEDGEGERIFEWLKSSFSQTTYFVLWWVSDWLLGPPTSSTKLPNIWFSGNEVKIESNHYFLETALQISLTLSAQGSRFFTAEFLKESGKGGWIHGWGLKKHCIGRHI